MNTSSISHNLSLLTLARYIGSARACSSACLAAFAMACVLIPTIPANAVDWANTGTDFNAGPSWSGGVAPGAADLAVFAGPMVTSPVNSADLSILGLQFSSTDSSGYTISSTSGTLTLLSLDYSLNPMPPLRGTAIFAANTSGTNTISANLALNPQTAAAESSDFYQAGGGTMNISGNISGTPGGKTNLYYDGNGRFIISGNNTYNYNQYGGTGVGWYSTTTGTSSTTVVARSNNAFSNGYVTVTLGGAVQFDTDVTIANSFILRGQGNGSGALRNVSGNTTLQGTIQSLISEDVVRIQSDAGSLTLQGDYVTGGATIILQGDGAGVISGNITGTGSVFRSSSGTGTWTLSGTNTYTGETDISGSGTLQIGNGGTTGSLSTSSSILNNGNLVFNRSDTITQGVHFNNLISGTGSVTQAGTGTLVLSGVNTYTGATTVNAGTLLVSGSLAADSAVTVSSGARIGGSGTIAGTLSLALGAQFVFSLTDTLNTTGGVTLDNSFGVASLVNSDGSAVNWAGVADGTYTLINSGSSFANISNWEFANRATGLGGGKEAYFQAGSLQLVVIPEPATWALLAFSLTTVVVLRRRARQE